ncbi:MAG TPA: lysylphosphatidylglycerol synthase domain-containing protein [Acidimicrobiia bacterium]
MSTRQRHPADLLRLGLGCAVVGAGAGVARMPVPSTFEIDLFRFVNDLPDALHIPLEVVMQLGSLAAVIAVAALALAFRRPWMALSAGLAGGAGSVVAHFMRQLVGRGRPAELLTHLIVRGPRITDFGYPSGHTTTATALVAGVAPYLPRPARRAAWTAVGLVAIARVYVGAHLPLDVIGGIALGSAIGALVNLAIGTPSRELDAGLVLRVLGAGHYPVRELTPLPDHGNDSTPFDATLADGTRVFVKAVDREHRDADALAAVGRYLAFRHIEDEAPFATAKQRVEHEALLASLAAHAGVHAALPLAITSAHPGPSVLVLSQIEGRAIGEEASALDDATATALWKEVACLGAARIAHRHLSLHNVMLDQTNQPWIVDFGYAEAGASDRALAQDVAELLGSLALVVGPQRAVDTAVATLGKPVVTAALPLIQPLALATKTRRALRHHRGLLDEVRNQAADAVGAEHVKLEPLTRVRARSVLTLVALLIATYLLLPQVGEFHQTFTAARHAESGWLVLALLTSIGTFLAAALSLSGAVLVPLAYGRTFVTQLASSFSNKITPAGLGGMGVNVRYLERSGVSKGDAVGAVALNGTVGFVVHIAALVISATLLGHTGLPAVHLPSGWVLLVAAAVLSSLVGIVLETSFGRKHILLPTERTGRDLLAVVRRPTKAAQMFGGAFLVLASYVVALGFALTAFHAHASWLDVTAVYLGGSAVASAAPTPGKVGAVEAALIAGLTGVGIASGPAVAGVLAFRLATFWLPIIPGYLAFRSLTQRELL